MGETTALLKATDDLGLLRNEFVRMSREVDYDSCAPQTCWESTTSSQTSVGNHAGKREFGGLPRGTHIVEHCIRKEETHTFTKLVDRFGLMPEVCDLLDIHPEALLDPTTFHHSLNRYTIYG